MDLRTVLLGLRAALDAEGVEHALIGGLALAAHGAGRATVDLEDLADVEKLLRTAEIDLERVREHFFDREKELDALLALAEEWEHALFGDPPVDRRPWRGDDFRL